MTISKALREQVIYNGKRYEKKCYIRWCKNVIDVFNFQVKIPESKAGETILENLRH